MSSINSINNSQLEALTQCLNLVLITERPLEPWICDTICDNIRFVLDCCPNKTSFDQKLLSSLRDIIHTNIHNVKLKLQIAKLVLHRFDFDFKETYDFLVHLDQFPAETLDICTLEIMESLMMRSDASCVFDTMLKTIRESAGSLNNYLRKASVSWLARYCTVFFQEDHESVHRTLEDELDDKFLCDVLITIYETDNDCQNFAVQIINKYFPRLVSPGSKGFKHLNKIRAHMVFQSLSDALESSNVSQAIDYAKLNYDDTDLHNQSFYRELFGSLVSSRELRATEKIVANICKAQNIVILSVVSSSVLSEKNSPEQANSFWGQMLQNQFASHKLLQKTMDIIYNDCANMREQRCALSILSDIIDKDKLISIITTSDVCHHYSLCDQVNFRCFMSTFLTYLKECSVDSFAMLSDLTPKLSNLPEFANSCDFLQSQLTKLLLQKLMNGDSRVRDLALDLVGKLDQSIVDSSVVKHILSASYTDEDYYIKSSCFKVLSDFHSVKLSNGLDATPPLCTLNKIITCIEHDDSMVTISFFQFLEKHYNFVSELIQKNVDVIANESKLKTKGPKLDQGSDQNRHLDVDKVIHEVCDSGDCADVSLIAAYHEKETVTSYSQPEEQLVSGIFRLLASDRCDVERMKASLELITVIIRSLPEVEKSIVIKFMKHGYFEMVESFNSPFLKQTIREFNSVLEGASVFPELQTPKNQNLLTVLTLLKSTPDPDLHMDCY